MYLRPNTQCHSLPDTLLNLFVCESNDWKLGFPQVSDHTTAFELRKLKPTFTSARKGNPHPTPIRLDIETRISGYRDPHVCQDLRDLIVQRT